MIKRLLYCLAVFVLLLSLSGCGGNPDGDGAKVVDKEVVETSPEQSDESMSSEKSAESNEEGTRENPLPIGKAAVVGEWEISIKEVNFDGGEAIAKANQFNDPAAEGNKYVIVNVDAKYVGEDSGTFWTDISSKFYGGAGNTFDSGSVVVDNSLSDTGETFPGASVSGNMVFEVPVAQIEGGAIILEMMLFDEPTRTFFAVK